MSFTNFEDFIEIVREANPIEDVIQSKEFGGVALDGRGHLWTGISHDSLKVSIYHQNYFWYSLEDKDKYWKGDVYSWVMRERSCDFMEALRILAERANLPMPRFDDAQMGRIAAIRITEEAYDIAAKIFADWLWKDEAALSYARSRGWSDETIREARLGFTGRGTKAEYEQMKTALSPAIDIHSPTAVAILGLRGGVKAWGENHGVDVSRWAEQDYIPSFLGWSNIFGLVYPFVERGRVVYFSRRNLQLDDGGKLIGVDKPKSYNLPKELAGERRMYRNAYWSKHTERGIFVEGPADAVTFVEWEFQRRELLRKYRNDQKDPPAWLESMPEMSATAIIGKEWGKFAEAIGHETKDEDGHDASFIGLDSDKAGMGSIKGERGAEFAIAEHVGAMTRLLEFPEKDANDWLKWMIQSSVQVEDQLELVNQQLGMAKPLAVHVARWMGSQRSEDQLKKASERAAKIINSMGDTEIQFYMKDFLEALKPLGEKFKTKRDIDQWLGKDKKDRSKQEKEDKDNVIYSYGGKRVGKWIFEYCFKPEENKSFWAYRDPEGNVGEADELMIDGMIHRPNPPTDKMVVEGAALFPSGLARKKDGSIDRRSTRELTIATAAEFRKDYLFADSKWAMLTSYWVGSTWVYDNFHELVYLRMVGDAGAGKSALLNLIGQVAYRSIKMSGADTESTFFRVVDDFRGTILLEEADLPEGSGPENPIVKFVNLGAFDGNFIYRMEEFIKPDGTKGWRPAPFRTYCPKAFAMRGDFMDNAVQQRAITIKLTSAESSEMKANETPWRLTAEIMGRLLRLRNLWLTWRLFEYSMEERELGWDLIDTEIPMRFNQVTAPLKSLAKNVDGTKDEEFLNQMETLLREHYRDLIGDNATTWQARTAEALWKIYTLPDLQERIEIKDDGSMYIKVGDITAITNNIADEMNEEGSELRVRKIEYETVKGADGEEKQVEKKRPKKEFEKGAQSIGNILRKDFQLEFPPRSGKGYRVKWDHAKMTAIGKKYGCLPSQEAIEAAEQALAARRAKIPTRKAAEAFVPSQNAMFLEDSMANWGVDE